MTSYTIRFSTESTHWVNVVLHRSRTVMRRFLTRRSHTDSANTDACCWQGHRPGTDHCIAEIHLARPHLTVSTIVHECSHAAFHRAVLMGIPLDHEKFQEWVADDTGRLAEALLARFDCVKIQVRYDCLKTRPAPSSRST